MVATERARSEPEGLHCVRRNKLTLFGVKYNTTYYFTLYIVSALSFSFLLSALSSIYNTIFMPFTSFSNQRFDWGNANGVHVWMFY